jgi:hypothetical protein
MGFLRIYDKSCSCAFRASEGAFHINPWDHWTRIQTSRASVSVLSMFFLSLDCFFFDSIILFAAGALLTASHSALGYDSPIFCRHPGWTIIPQDLLGDGASAKVQHLCSK